MDVDDDAEAGDDSEVKETTAGGEEKDIESSKEAHSVNIQDVMESYKYPLGRDTKYVKMLKTLSTLPNSYTEKFGQIVWAKGSSSPWWPAVVYSPLELKAHIFKEYEKRIGKGYFVCYYNNGMFQYVPKAFVVGWEEGLNKKYDDVSEKKGAESIPAAVDEAKDDLRVNPMMRFRTNHPDSKSEEHVFKFCFQRYPWFSEDIKGNDLVGHAINVGWEDGFYSGAVGSYDAEKGTHKIYYDDGDEADECLEERNYHLWRRAPDFEAIHNAKVRATKSAAEKKKKAAAEKKKKAAEDKKKRAAEDKKKRTANERAKKKDQIKGKSKKIVDREGNANKPTDHTPPIEDGGEDEAVSDNDDGADQKDEGNATVGTPVSANESGPRNDDSELEEPEEDVPGPDDDKDKDSDYEDAPPPRKNKATKGKSRLRRVDDSRDAPNGEKKRPRDKSSSSSLPRTKKPKKPKKSKKPKKPKVQINTSGRPATGPKSKQMTKEFETLANVLMEFAMLDDKASSKRARKAMKRMFTLSTEDKDDSEERKKDWLGMLFTTTAIRAVKNARKSPCMKVKKSAKFVYGEWKTRFVGSTRGEKKTSASTKPSPSPSSPLTMPTPSAAELTADTVPKEEHSPSLVPASDTTAAAIDTSTMGESTAAPKSDTAASTKKDGEAAPASDAAAVASGQDTPSLPECSKRSNCAKRFASVLENDLTLAIEVESALHGLCGADAKMYGSKMRLLWPNLRRSEWLRTEVCSGRILPAKLVRMSSVQMQDQEARKRREEAVEKYRHEAGTDIHKAPVGATTAEFKCEKCGQRKCTYTEIQTRSADEPMTTFVTCQECKFEWRIY
eukprot:g3127.t1